ncbi:hypothetical protein [Desnuesiella massiliensis]|uniref:hypothetical protein n=1 Tax=Desnuesiella massiliensis TaxID=1650662 RepID=UPI0006E44A88|nr:hypothetical protein [Desnuesiella massiliensis]
MKISKAIASFMCVLALISCIGCNKTDKKSVASDDNKSINEPKVISKEQPPNEDIEDYKIKPNIIFYVLKDEYLENNDVNNPNVSELIRVFICYDGVENQIYSHSSTVFFDKVVNIQELRDKLFLKHPNTLKLPPNTIVSSKVLKVWESQHYNGLGSYSDESPSGLTYSKIRD